MITATGMKELTYSFLCVTRKRNKVTHSKCSENNEYFSKDHSKSFSLSVIKKGHPAHLYNSEYWFAWILLFPTLCINDSLKTQYYRLISRSCKSSRKACKIIEYWKYWSMIHSCESCLPLKADSRLGWPNNF